MVVFLYVDTANQYRATMDFGEAVIEAGATRMRPMFMTTLTTIVAMIPMAAAYGNAGKTMQGLALVDCRWTDRLYSDGTSCSSGLLCDR